MLGQTRSFIKDRGGNFAIIFGLSLVPLMGLAGAAVDYSRILKAENRLQSAADAAALAAASGGDDVNDMRRIAASFLESNAPDLSPTAETTVSGNTLTVAYGPRSICLYLQRSAGRSRGWRSPQVSRAHCHWAMAVRLEDGKSYSPQVVEAQIAIARRQFARAVRKLPQHMREKNGTAIRDRDSTSARALCQPGGALRITR
ncbi:MAG: TadE/TadG family type IV pilus assembly protein [Nitratireductor sp.]